MKTSLGSEDAEITVSLSNLFQSLAIPTIPSHCKSSRFPVLFCFFFPLERGYSWVSMCYVIIPVLEK